MRPAIPSLSGAETNLIAMTEIDFTERLVRTSPRGKEQ